MILTDEICDVLCQTALEESRKAGADMSFAICDENGLPRVFRRFGQALILSITLVPQKAYTAVVTRCPSGEVAKAAVEGGPLYAIQDTDSRLCLVAGGYPLFSGGQLVGGIGVGGGTEEQDCAVAQAVLQRFAKLNGQ